jgi:hypothetical protein
MAVSETIPDVVAGSSPVSVANSTRMKELEIKTKEFDVVGKKLRLKYTTMSRNVALETFTDNDYFGTEYKFNTQSQAEKFFDSFSQESAKAMKLMIDFAMS